MLSPKHDRKGAFIVLSVARELKANLRLLQIAASRKFSTVTKGKSPVSISCQIPNLRERYESFGFSPHTGYFVEVGAFDGEVIFQHVISGRSGMVWIVRRARSCFLCTNQAAASI